MQFSKEAFKKTLFLKITKNAIGKRSLRCFINNQEFKSPAVMVYLDDLSLWVTPKFTIKNCTMLPLSAEAFEMNEKAYTERMIAFDDYQDYINVHQHLRNFFCVSPTLLSYYMLKHIRHQARVYVEKMIYERGGFQLSYVLPQGENLFKPLPRENREEEKTDELMLGQKKPATTDVHVLES